MPLNEYECQDCGHRFEVIQKFSDPLLEECPECEDGELKKLLSPPALHFKGSGWYVTDYARKDDNGAPKNAAAESDGSAAESSSSTEPTPTSSDSTDTA